MMNLTTRLRQLEEVAAAADAGRCPARSMSDDLLADVLGSWVEWLSIIMPPRPWSVEARRALEGFWDGSFGLGTDCDPDGKHPWFCLYGFSRYQLQTCLRHLAAEFGLQLATFHPVDRPDGLRPIDRADLGPYRWDAGMKYRDALQEKYGKGYHKVILEEAQAVADEARRRGDSRTASGETQMRRTRLEG